MFLNVLTVGCGGFIGAALRYLLSFLNGKLEVISSFPVGTFLTNLVGCFLMGFLAFWLPSKFPEHGRMLLFATTGCLGGFTTLSTFAMEGYKLLSAGEYGVAVLYILGSLLFCVIGLAAGIALSKVLQG